MSAPNAPRVAPRHVVCESNRVGFSFQYNVPMRVFLNAVVDILRTLRFVAKATKSLQPNH